LEDLLSFTMSFCVHRGPSILSAIGSGWRYESDFLVG